MDPCLLKNDFGAQSTINFVDRMSLVKVDFLALFVINYYHHWQGFIVFFQVYGIQ
jgi:hypothetical protein